jgi:DNA/RNA endonuclease G (NUC1)
LTQAQKQEGMIRETKQLVRSQGARGHNAVARHGATFSKQAGTDPFYFGNIAQQGNLDNRGKELAKALGDAGRGAPQNAGAGV